VVPGRPHYYTCNSDPRGKGKGGKLKKGRERLYGGESPREITFFTLEKNIELVVTWGSNFS